MLAGLNGEVHVMQGPTGLPGVLQPYVLEIHLAPDTLENNRSLIRLALRIEHLEDALCRHRHGGKRTV